MTEKHIISVRLAALHGPNKTPNMFGSNYKY